MYPYYNPYAVFFGNPTGQAVTTQLSDFQISVAEVLDNLINLSEKARIQAKAHWVAEGFDDVDLNMVMGQAQAQIRTMASTRPALEAISEMITKMERKFREPVPVVAPQAKQEFDEYIEFVNNQLVAYQQAVQEELTPDTYQQLSVEQKAEVDALQEEMNVATKKVDEARRAALPWYKTEIPFYIGGGLMAIVGIAYIARSLK